jgi:hypothetical protein
VSIDRNTRGDEDIDPLDGTVAVSDFSRVLDDPSR